MCSYIKPLTCFLIAILMGVSFLIFKTPPIRNDSLGNHTAGIEVSKGNFDVLASATPIYPLFVGICFRMFGEHDNAVRIVQVFMSAIVSLLVYAFASRYYGKNVGFIAGLLYACCPTFAHYPGFFLRESLLVLLFFLTYILILKAFRTNNIVVSCCAVFSLLILSLTKPVFWFFGLFTILVLLILCRKHIYRAKRVARTAIIIGVLPILFLSGLAYHAHKSLPGFIEGGGGTGGIFLYNAAELALSDKELAARFIGLISRNLSEKIFPEINFRTLWPYPEVVQRLLKEADSRYSQLPHKASRRLHMAIDLYKEHPFGYFINRITTLIRLNAFQYPSRLNETDRWKDFYNRGNNKSLVVIVLDLVLKLLSNPFFWAVGGFVVMKRKKLPILPILLPALYINLVYCLLDGIPRYGLPALPFYFIAGGVVFYYFFEWVQERFPVLARFKNFASGN